MAVCISFAAKKVIVTGGGTGLGRNIVEKLYNDGAIVYTLDKSTDLIAQLKDDFPNITAVECDVSDWDATKSIVESFGPVDYLVNNVGIPGFKEKFGSITEQAIDKTYAVNFKSAVNVSQVVAKGMIENNIQGSIVNVSSLTSRFALEYAMIYGTTKAAMVNLTKAMAYELRQSKIRVNCVCPNFINTNMLKAVPELAAPWIARTLNERVLEPEEVTDMILFLLSSKAAMINGEEIFIDGGFSAH